MHFLQQLKTVPLFIGYFFRVVDHHSLHAPYVYHFYTQLKREIRHAGEIEEIEAARKSLMNDHTLISGHDCGAGPRRLFSNKSQSISSITKYGISSKKDCIFLLSLAKFIKPENCIELGTSLGIATAYLSKTEGLKTLYSFEGNDMLVGKARHLMQQLDCRNVIIIPGNIDSSLTRILDTIDRLDFAVIDANHRKSALLRYYHQLSKKMSENGIIVVDDIRWSAEMHDAWRELVSLQEVRLSIEFLNTGVLFFKKGLRKQHYILSL